MVFDSSISEIQNPEDLIYSETIKAKLRFHFKHTSGHFRVRLLALISKFRIKISMGKAIMLNQTIYLLFMLTDNWTN